MDGFDSEQFYGHNLSMNDPKLRTTARNYEFKYNSSEYLEQLITTVRNDRDKKRPTSTFDQRCLYPIKVRSTSLQRQCKIANVETEINRSTSRTTVIKVMSDDEIEAMLTEALATKEIDTRSTGNLSESKTLLESLERSEQSDFCISPKRQIIDMEIELIPEPIPQWVEVKPVSKGNLNIIQYMPIDVGTENDKVEDDKIEDDKVEDDKIEDNKVEDIVFRHPEWDIQLADESPPNSLVSIGAESRLNESERAEMERIFGKQATDAEKTPNEEKSDEDSDIVVSGSDQDDDNIEVTQDEASSSDTPEFKGCPIIHIQHNCRQEDTQTGPTSESKSNVILARTHPSPRGSPKNNIKRERPIIMPLDRRVKKQIETLKHEKIRIFSKMTSIQEKIIEILDKLKLNLLEHTVPDGQAEKKLRERNAFEFSVRFSRNYIFPLGRMIEELRSSPKSDFCSAVTNEPCIKVCTIYGLLCQGLQCYSRQLRHFFNDNVPKKLDIILNMIMDTTNLCLEKKVFDRRDILIQSVLLRCTIFMEFIMKLAEQKRAMEEEIISHKSSGKDLLKLSKTSSKWDLTMNLNKLNMYEPKLVPKKVKKKPIKNPPLWNSSQKIPPAPVPSATPETLFSVQTIERARESNKNYSDTIKDIIYDSHPSKDIVETQIQQINNCDSVQLINTAIEDNFDPNLTKTVIEALQEITKDEVHQMLGPFVSNLGSILKSPVSLTQIGKASINHPSYMDVPEETPGATVPGNVVVTEYNQA